MHLNLPESYPIGDGKSGPPSISGRILLMKLFASLRRCQPSNRRLNLIGLAVVCMTVLAAGLTIWDLRQEAIKIYTEEIGDLGNAFAEQTSRSLQAVDLVLDQI